MRSRRFVPVIEEYPDIRKAAEEGTYCRDLSAHMLVPFVSVKVSVQGSILHYPYLNRMYIPPTMDASLGLYSPAANKLIRAMGRDYR